MNLAVNWLRSGLLGRAKLADTLVDKGARVVPPECVWRTAKRIFNGGDSPWRIE